MFSNCSLVSSAITLVQGPWIKAYGVAFDDEGRIDDAPGHSGRLAGPEGSQGTWSDPGVLEDPASRAGTVLLGVEMGLLKFLELDYEAVAKLGRAYVAGSIDFAKVKAEIFGDLLLEKPDFDLVNWRFNGDPSCHIGFRIGAQVLAELIGAHYEAGLDTAPIPMLGRELPIELTGRLDAAVHAFARAYLDVTVGTRCALIAGGKAFAGASATLAGQVELASLVGAYGSVTGWAGVGAECTLGIEADFVHQKFGFTHSAGVACGVGASYDYGVSVSPGELYSSSELSPRMPEILGEFLETVDSSGRAALAGEKSPQEFAADVGLAAGRAIGEVAGAVGDSLP